MNPGLTAALKSSQHRTKHFSRCLQDHETWRRVSKHILDHLAAKSLVPWEAHTPKNLRLLAKKGKKGLIFHQLSSELVFLPPKKKYMEEDESWHEQKEKHSGSTRQKASEEVQYVTMGATKITLFHVTKMGVGGYDVMLQGSQHTEHRIFWNDILKTKQLFNAMWLWEKKTCRNSSLF